jgi:methane/ammonia monooxygenase subunit C
MAADSSGRGYDVSQWYDSKPVKIGWFAMLAIGVFWVVYQRTFGYSHGLDSMTPEFESVWMGLWRFNIVANALFFATSIGWIWVTRDRNLANLDPKLELKRYFYWMGWLVCYIWGVYYAGSYTLEQAPSDHPGHELYGEPHCGVLRDVPAVHYVRRVELPVCADAVAAV